MPLAVGFEGSMVLSLEARGAAPRNELCADVLDGSIQTQTSVYAADFGPQRPKLGRSEPVLNAFEFCNHFLL